MKKAKLLILGKLPPPYMGPSVAFKILINSSLRVDYELNWFDVQTNRTLNNMGTWSLKKIFANLYLYFSLLNLGRKVKPDIVLIPISQSTPGFLKDSIFILICRILNLKIMVQLRGGNFKNWINSSHSWVKVYVKKVLSGTHGVIVLGENLRHLFEDYFPSDRIYVVPNGANFTPTNVNKHKSDTVNVMYLGNLQRSKGIEDVINAMVILNKKYPGRIHLTVIGEWRHEKTKQKCLRIITDHQLPLTIFGQEASVDKINHLANSDIFVFAPRAQEGHPWVIIEAMACGLPIVTTNQGAIIESVTDQVNGFIVPPENPVVLAEKLEILTLNPGLRDSMGKQSRLKYLENFTENKMIENYKRVFNQVLNIP